MKLAEAFRIFLFYKMLIPVCDLWWVSQKVCRLAQLCEVHVCDEPHPEDLRVEPQRLLRVCHPVHGFADSIIARVRIWVIYGCLDVLVA